jgi:hypothetical protein
MVVARTSYGVAKPCFATAQGGVKPGRAPFLVAREAGLRDSHQASCPSCIFRRVSTNPPLPRVGSAWERVGVRVRALCVAHGARQPAASQCLILCLLPPRSVPER